jgi:hypothetical protein
LAVLSWQQQRPQTIAAGPHFSPRFWKGGAEQAAEKLESPVILRSSGDEESRIAMKMLRARSFAALRMTALERFSAASKSPPFQIRGEKSRLNACSTLSGCGTLECGKPDHSRTQDEKHGE